jgi:hypothetical protein
MCFTVIVRNIVKIGLFQILLHVLLDSNNMHVFNLPVITISCFANAQTPHGGEDGSNDNSKNHEISNPGGKSWCFGGDENGDDKINPWAPKWPARVNSYKCVSKAGLWSQRGRRVWVATPKFGEGVGLRVKHGPIRKCNIGFLSAPHSEQSAISNHF